MVRAMTAPYFAVACDASGCTVSTNLPQDPDELGDHGDLSLQELVRHLLVSPQGLTVYGDLSGDYMAPEGSEISWFVSLWVVKDADTEDEKAVGLVPLLTVKDREYRLAQWWADALAAKLNTEAGRLEVYQPQTDALCTGAAVPWRSRRRGPAPACHVISERRRWLGLCAPAGHLVAWMRRRIKRLLTEPPTPGPVPCCRYCQEAAAYGWSRTSDGVGSYDPHRIVYLCDSPSCERRRGHPHDLGGWPSERLGGWRGLAAESVLLAERALLRGDWREVAAEDERARFWRLAFGARRLLLVWAERRAAKPKRSKRAK